MKLVDILARDLKVWPGGLGGMSAEAVSQDLDGQLNTLDYGEEAHINQCEGGVWSSSMWTLTDVFLPIAQDQSTAIVTLIQWQTAVDALKSKNVVEWTGEGLPPVGAVCEFAGGTPCPEDPFDKDLKEGMPVTIIAHIKSGDFTLAEFTFDPKNPDRGMVQVEMGNFGCFRPIRTPEQIAAQEECAAIKEIAIATGLRAGSGQMEVARALYMAGYRKQVQP